MSSDKAKLSGPDLTQAVELSTIPDGTMLLGHAQREPVLLARRGDEVFAIGAICTHYGAPRSSRGSSSGILFDAPGITPVSTCAPERLSAPRHWTRSPAGVSKRCATWRVSSHQSMSRSVPYSSGRSWSAGSRGHGLQQSACRDPSLSSAAVRPEMPPPKRFAAKAIPAALRC
jgi:hypothetical protein